MTAVAILVPVLGRPHRVGPTIESVAAATPEPHRLLFVASEDDRAELAALDAAGADVLVVPANRRSWAKKINDGFRATTEPWVFTGADDLAFHPGWFPRALAWADDRTGVIGTNDLWNPRVMTREHSTHSLVRRAYIDKRGTADDAGLVVHEGYGHDWADDELVETAKARGAWVHATDSIVEHLRPRNRADEDDTYRLGRDQSRDGKRLFLTRRRLWLNPAAPKVPPPTRAVVVTACYGGVDTVLHGQAAQDLPVDWICFTDQPDHVQAPAPWKVIHSPARFDHPCLAAKVHKATPTVLDCPDVVWIDASMQVTSPLFVREALAARHDGVATFKHPRRDCIFQEADASLGAEGQGGKYSSQPLLAQVAHYRAEGHPEQGGLYACGVVAWDLTDPRAVELGRQWLAECERWSWQDQLSFPVVARRLGIEPGVFPVRQIERTTRGFLSNRWLRIHPHVVTPAAPPPAPTAVSVLIPYASADEHRARARAYVADWYATHHPAWEVIEGHCEGEWSKGRALADAATRATHDVLVIADADSILVPDVLGQAATLVAGGAPWVVPHQKVYRYDRVPTERIYAGAEPEPNRGWCIKQRGFYTGVAGGGILVLSRAAWNAVGGIDPRFTNWGAEDLSVALALDTLVGRHVRLDAGLVHFWHELEDRGAKRVGGPENTALWQRYAQAAREPESMRALVGEFQSAMVGIE